MGRFGGAAQGLGMGMSNGGAVPGGALGVGGFEFEFTVPCRVRYSSWRLSL